MSVGDPPPPHAHLMGSSCERSRFCEADIDELLARGSRVVQIGDATEDGEEEEAGSRLSAFNFSKTSFQATEGDGDLDFNDPDFWTKVC